MADSLSIPEAYRNVFSALDDAAVCWCLLRDDLSDRILPDLDVLVANDQFQAAIQCLEALGFQLRVTERYLPCKSVLVAFLDGQFVTIDLHAELVQNGIIYLPQADILQRRQRVGQWWLPAPADLLSILLLHNVIGKGCIQEKHVSTLQQLSNQIAADAQTGDLAEANAGSRPDYFSGSGADTLNQLLHDLWQDWPTLVAEPVKVQALAEQLRAAYKVWDRQLSARLLRYKARQWWREHGPMPRAPVYALLGVDGTGKSSLTDALLALLNEPGGFNHATQYMGPWGHYLLPWKGGSPYVDGWSLTTAEWLQGVKELLGSRQRPSLAETVNVVRDQLKGQDLNAEQQALHERVRDHSVLYLSARYVRSQLRTAGFFAVLSAEMATRSLVIYRYRRKGKVVIADRYVYDLMTGGMHEWVPQYEGLRRLLCKLVPAPTAVFLLHNDAEVILARKQDLDADTLRQFQAFYEGLATEYGFRKIKTNRPPEELAKLLVAGQFEEMVSLVKT